MKNKIRVVIADDHDIYLEGLESRLNSSGNIEVVEPHQTAKNWLNW